MSHVGPLSNRGLEKEVDEGEGGGEVGVVGV